MNEKEPKIVSPSKLFLNDAIFEKLITIRNT